MPTTNAAKRVNTDFKLVRLGFGGAAIGLTDYVEQFNAGSSQNRAISIGAIRQAAAGGINYFDTAPGYGNGLSETLMGEALRQVETPFFLASKAHLGPAGSIRQSLENSLERLQRDQIDLLQIHGSSYSAEQVEHILKPGGVLAEMQQLRDEGLIRYIGFTSEDNNDAVYQLINTGEFDAIQLAYNLLLQHPYEPTRPFGSLFEASKRGMLTVTMRTATSGIFQKWMQLVHPSNSFDYTESLLQFVLSNKLVDVALVGMRTEAVVQSCLSVLNDRAGRLDIDALWDRYDI
ncbi:MAG: aldo/keto reductase [Rhodobacteraceae bacterium]|nr:aldo/keto reductase [Paracoccaceae bacterium]